VVAGTVARDGSVTLEVASTSTGDDATATYTLDAEFVVNAAGLHAVQVREHYIYGGMGGDPHFFLTTKSNDSVIPLGKISRSSV
jgi:L-2-hydroxyglutarate oxidase LhgO